MYCPLKKYYDYWDNFIEEWKRFLDLYGYSHSQMWSSYDKRIYPHLTKWSYPQYQNTMNLLPGAWWGFYCDNLSTAQEKLNAVVINYNPKADKSNTGCSLLNGLKFHEYVTDSVNSFINKKTNTKKTVLDTKKASNWHYTNRAEPIFKALNYKLNPNKFDTSKTSLKKILSLEIIPWCTPNTINLYDYIEHNHNVIFNYIIKFAAEASKLIDNDDLRNIVLVRMAAYNFKLFMGGVGGFNYVKKETIISKSDTKYSIYEFTQIPDVKFVCIWAKKYRNRFPNNLQEVFVELKKKNII